MLVSLGELVLKTGDFCTQLVDYLDLWVYVLSGLVRYKRGLHSIVESAEVLFYVFV